MKYVLLSNDAVIAEFAGPQSVTDDKPGYAEVDDADTRYLAWLSPPAPPKPQQITATAFLNRFTDAERAALATAAQSNPQMLLLLITCAAAGTIDLTDPAVQGGINGLVPGVLATTARASAILDH